MAEPSTSGAARRHGLRTTRWVAAGASVGAAVLLTGTIAVVNAAPSDANSSDVSSNGQVRSDDGNRESDDGSRDFEDDDDGTARPYTPTQQTPTQPAPTFTPQPQTRTRGS